MDRGGFVKAIAATLAIAAVFAVICALFGCIVGGEEVESTRPIPDALDVVSYDAPMWATERMSDCWLLQDRQHHRNWWLIKLDGQWVTLDAGEVTEP